MSKPDFTKGQIVTLIDLKTKLRVSGVLEKCTAKTLKVVFDSNGRLASLTSDLQFTPDVLMTELAIRPHEGTPVSTKLQSRIDEGAARP